MPSDDPYATDNGLIPILASLIKGKGHSKGKQPKQPKQPKGKGKSK